MPSLAHSGAKKPCGICDEHAAAVAELGVGAGRAAMIEIDEDLQALLQDVVRLAVAHVGDEADAAGIMLPGRIVETLGARQERIGHDGLRATSGRGRERGDGGFAAVRAMAGERSPGA